jgi:tetratricopeptide (TPR) repeat protein
VFFLDQANQWSHDPHAFDQAIQLAQKSIALDNSNAVAYALMSRVYTITGQYDLGITAGERAIAFDPNSAPVYQTMSLTLAFSGKPAEGLVAAHEAMRLDPSNRDFYSLFQCRCVCNDESSIYEHKAVRSEYCSRRARPRFRPQFSVGLWYFGGSAILFGKA